MYTSKNLRVRVRVIGLDELGHVYMLLDEMGLDEMGINSLGSGVRDGSHRVTCKPTVSCLYLGLNGLHL